MNNRMVSRILPATIALVALSAVLCLLGVTLMGSSHTAETVLASKPVNKRAEWAKCAKMAKSFYGTKPGQREITKEEKLQAKQCLHLVKMAKKLKMAEKQKLAAPAAPKCECCAFAGCPCCQPAIKSGVTQLQHLPKKQHFFHEKHPFFHKKGNFAKKAAKLYKPDHPKFKIAFDF